MTIQRGDGDERAAVDVALPAATAVGELLPSLVDILDGTARATGRRWRLCRLGGGILDESMSLAANGIHDGDILMLTTTEPPRPLWVDVDACHTVARLVDTGDPSVVVARTAWLLFAAGASAALVWSPAAVTARLITAIALAIAAAAGAVVLRRTRDDSPATTLAMVAVTLAAAAGAVAVPPGPIAAHALLAAAAAAAMSVLMLRLINGGTACLTAVATGATSIAAASAAAVAWRLPLETSGVLLAALALALLSAAPRVAIGLTGIGPPPPSVDPPVTEGGETDARRAHRTLTGLVMGAAVTATTGSAVAAFGDRSPAAVVFTCVVGLVLVLRARIHADSNRRQGLQVTGLSCLTVSFVAAVAAVPGWTPALCALAASACSSTLGVTASPGVRRMLDVVEYLALAAVVPLACGIGGVFAFVRGLALS